MIFVRVEAARSSKSVMVLKNKGPQTGRGGFGAFWPSEESEVLRVTLGPKIGLGVTLG
jgi:hypothetical protein